MVTLEYEGKATKEDLPLDSFAVVGAAANAARTTLDKRMFGVSDSLVLGQISPFLACNTVLGYES